MTQLVVDCLKKDPSIQSAALLIAVEDILIYAFLLWSFFYGFKHSNCLNVESEGG